MAESTKYPNSEAEKTSSAYGMSQSRRRYNEVSCSTSNYVVQTRCHNLRITCSGKHGELRPNHMPLIKRGWVSVGMLR